MPKLIIIVSLYLQTSSPSNASYSSTVAYVTLPPMTEPMMYTNHVSLPGKTSNYTRQSIESKETLLYYFISSTKSLTTNIASANGFQ